MRYVIVGNSFAGMFAVEAIRSADRDGEIIMIGAEEDRLYSRALLHEYLGGLIDKSKVYLRDENFHDSMCVKLITGRRAENLQVNKRQLSVADETITYDKLLLTVGGAPFIPPGIDGLDTFKDSVFTFTKFADARELSTLIPDCKHVVVLGAGLIGMQAADAFAHQGKDVTVVEMADHILPLALDELAAGLVQREMETVNVSFRTAESVSALLGQSGKLRAVKLRSGGEIPADIFVIAIGVRPDIGWLKETPIIVDRGIVVDDQMQTNIESVYAAGDCAQGLELISGSRIVLATIPIASEQGMVAGYNMVGLPNRYKGGIPMNALQFGRVQIISYGYVKAKEGQEVMTVYDEAQMAYKKVVLEDNRLIGALFVRAIDRAGLFRYLIEEKIDVTDFKQRLLLDDFGVAALPGQVREEMFARRRSRIDKQKLEHV